MPFLFCMSVLEYVYKEVERMEKHIYQTYVQVLKEELVPAMGCTEPIALAYCASKCFDTLQDEVQSVDIFVSGNIVKNVKSVIVPNTGGLKGIEASVAAGIVAGDSTKVLEVISIVTNLQKEEMRHFLDSISMKVQAIESDCASFFDNEVFAYHFLKTELIDTLLDMIITEHFHVSFIIKLHTDVT